jgi:outer membrane protein assembly factor BamB
MKRQTKRLRWITLLAATAMMVGSIGCGDQLEKPPVREPDTAELDRLRALPYIDYSPDPVDQSKRGVVLWDEQRSQPGYNLYSNHKLCSAYLIDAEGSTVRSWAHPGRHWSNTELLPNGDLLVVGTDLTGVDDEEPDDAHRFVMRFSWDGEVLWKRTLPAHHDVEITPRGGLLTLTAQARRISAFNRDIDVRDNFLALLDDDGQLEAERSLFDLFDSAPWFRFQPVRPRLRRGHPQIVLFHGNSAEWMPHEHLVGRNRIYDPGNVLVCTRHQDTIAVIDWDLGELVWSWGQGILSGPHDATTLENGNILVFDNGINRGWSRVIELDPLSRRIVWEYRAAEPTDFFTLTRGSSQRLPNGNTLIADSEAGRAFEVTRDGELVWDFWSPHLSEQGERGTIVRMKRYPVDYVDAILAIHSSPAGE